MKQTQLKVQKASDYLNKVQRTFALWLFRNTVIL